MKPEDAAKIVKQKLRGWTVVKMPPIADVAFDAPKTIGQSARTLVKKYSIGGVDNAALAKRMKLKTNGVSIIRVKPKKQGQDAPAYTKAVVVGDEGVIGMEG